MPALNLTGLQREAKNYQKDFRLLPYVVLLDTLKVLRISGLEVAYKDTIITRMRKGGITKPYTSSADAVQFASELSKLIEKDLVTAPAFAVVKDDIRQYRDKNYFFDSGKNKVNNQTKQHPLEREIISDIVKTVSEDIIDALFPAVRNTAVLTPLGMVNGFDTIITAAVTATEISAAKGNLVESGSLAAPVDGDDTTAWDNLVKWLRAVHPKTKSQELILRLPPAILLNVQDALENKLNKKDVEFEDILKHLRFRTDLPKLNVASHYCLGTGDRIHLTTPDNFDLGMNTMGDIDFVQVRQPYEDPNLTQFWMQFDIGTRITNFNNQVFMVNEGAPVANSLSGDY